MNDGLGVSRSYPTLPLPNTPPALPSTHLPRPTILVPLVPLIDLLPHTVPVAFILFATLDKQFWTVPRAAQMALEILPATVGLECAVCVGAAVGAECL